MNGDDLLLAEGVRPAERGQLEWALACFERAAGVGSRVRLLNAGRALRELGRHEEARSRFEAAADAGSIEALVDLGNLLDDHLSERVGAVGSFEGRPLRETPTARSPSACSGSGTGRLDDAERAYELAQRLGSAIGGSYLGGLRMERGDCGGARAAYEDAARTRPEAWTDWGAALSRAGHREEAQTVVRRAVPHDPEAVTLLGQLFIDDGRPAEAEAFYRQHLESAAGPDVRLDLSNLLAAEGRFDEALGVLGEAVERGDVRAFANLGATAKAMGDLDAAERHYREGAAAGDAIAQVGLASLLIDRDDRDEATAHLLAARAAGSEDARRLLEWLADDEAPH